jgi:hypothetical protein
VWKNQILFLKELFVVPLIYNYYASLVFKWNFKFSSDTVFQVFQITITIKIKMLSRYGFSTAPNYNDHELYCGGFTRQWRTNGGKCGICGDPWDTKTVIFYFLLFNQVPFDLNRSDWISTITTFSIKHHFIKMLNTTNIILSIMSLLENL